MISVPSGPMAGNFSGRGLSNQSHVSATRAFRKSNSRLPCLHLFLRHGRVRLSPFL